MDPGRWQRIQALWEQVVDASAEDRQALLRNACGDDTALLAEVTSLLQHDRDDRFLESPALELPLAPPRSRVGTRMAHYDVLEELGAGGMGVVYRARDTRLDRHVAIKVLTLEGGASATVRERVLLEARLASRLDHPNICTVYEVGEHSDGTFFLVMAYYEGQTLDERIRLGSVDASEAVDLVKQLAQGLSAAHGQGVVHRDIKPSNLFLTTSGVLKILDFGLAKVKGRRGLRTTGRVLGTVAYMSPEQAAGRSVDERTDIWSLGVVFYELLAGRLPFEAEHDVGMLDAIARGTPVPLRERRSDVPAEVEAIVTRALAADPAHRYQEIDEVVIDLASLGRKARPDALVGAPAAMTARADSSAVLQRITLQMTASLELPEVLTSIVEGLVEQFDAALARVWLVGPGDLCSECSKAPSCLSRQRCLHLRASAGLSMNLNGGHRRMPLGAYKIGHIAESREVIYSTNLPADERVLDKRWVETNGIQSFAGFPLTFGWDLLGVLALFARHILTPAERQHLELFARQTAIAIKNAQLLAELTTTTHDLRLARNELKRHLRRQQ